MGFIYKYEADGKNVYAITESKNAPFKGKASIRVELKDKAQDQGNYIEAKLEGLFSGKVKEKEPKEEKRSSIGSHLKFIALKLK